MEQSQFLMTAVLITLDLAIPSGALLTLKNVEDVNITEEHATAEAFLAMEDLISYYTPSCLQVQLLVNQMYNIPFYISSLLPTKLSKGIKYIKELNPQSVRKNQTSTSLSPQAHVFINVNYFHQSMKVIQYINKNTGKVTGTACVTYMLSGSPDARLLPVLTDPTSSKRLTRYFLVHTQNSTEAEQFLLDQRLGKEENVAALVQEESQNKSHWRVLIRQLLHPSGSPQVLTVNRWFRDTGLTSTENIFPDQMANFYGMKLTGMTLQFRPFAAYQQVEGSLLVQPRPSIDVYLLDMIASKMNFTYEIVMPEDGVWGGRKEDGHFQGIIGAVEQGRANFSLILSRTLARAEAVDFTRLYFMDPLTFMTAKSTPGSPWRKVLTPFRTSVWLCVLVSVGGGSLLYHVVYHAQATLTSSRLLSSHAFMHVLASFLSQSLHNYLSLQAGKVFLGFWLLYAFLITSYYKTSLTSTLAVPFAPPAINTLLQLYQSEYQYGIKPKTSQHLYFSSSDIGLYQNMFQRMSFYPNAENLHRAAEGGYAFISYRSYLAFQMTLHNSDPGRKGDLRIASEVFFPGGYAWGVPKGAPYRRGFDEVMLRCGEAGLVEKWFGDLTDYYVRESKEEKASQEQHGGQESRRSEDTRVVVFSLNHLQGPFFMLALGYGAGVLLLLMEMTMVRVFIQ